MSTYHMAPLASEDQVASVEDQLTPTLQQSELPSFTSIHGVSSPDVPDTPRQAQSSLGPQDGLADSIDVPMAGLGLGKVQ